MRRRAAAFAVAPPLPLLLADAPAGPAVAPSLPLTASPRSPPPTFASSFAFLFVVTNEQGGASKFTTRTLRLLYIYIYFPSYFPS